MERGMPSPPPLPPAPTRALAPAPVQRGGKPAASTPTGPGAASLSELQDRLRFSEMQLRGAKEDAATLAQQYREALTKLSEALKVPSRERAACGRRSVPICIWSVYGSAGWLDGRVGVWCVRLCVHRCGCVACEWGECAVLHARLHLFACAITRVSMPLVAVAVLRYLAVCVCVSTVCGVEPLRSWKKRRILSAHSF